MTTGNSKGPSKIPNLYEVLNLQPKESDDQAIRSALRLYAEQVKKMQPGEPAQAAAKLFAIAKQNLLDPVKKSAYDSLWDKVFGASPSTQPKQSTATSTQERSSEKRKERANSSVVSAISQTVEKVVSAAHSTESKAMRAQARPAQTEQPIETAQFTSITQEPTWDLSELETILPSGDPSAPLDLSAFLESTELNADGQRTMEDLDRDFQKLLSLLGVEVQQDVFGARAATASGAPAPTTGSQSSLFDFDSVSNSRQANSTNAAQATSLGFSGSVESLPPVVAAPRPAVSSARSVPPSKVRKKRDRSLLMMVSGGLTVLLAVLGVLLVMLKRSNDQRSLAAGNPPATPTQNAEPNVGNTPKPSGLPKAGSGLPQTGSGLPKPGENMASGGNDASMVLDPSMQAEAPMQPADSIPPTTTPTVNSAPPMQPATPPSMTPSSADPTPPKPNENPTEPTKTDSKPDTSKPDMSNPTEMPMVEEAKVELTAQEKATWKKQMRQARNLLGERQYEQAKELLGKIEPTAKSGQQKAQLRRLSTVADFAEQFNSAMMSALDELKADGVGEITVGNQVIIFVDSSDEKLVVRMNGARKQFLWKDIPINLAYGYADLKLDQGPKSAAAKASFAAVHTKMNPAAIENARKLMQSASAAEVVPADTHEVFEDDYALE